MNEEATAARNAQLKASATKIRDRLALAGVDPKSLDTEDARTAMAQAVDALFGEWDQRAAQMLANELMHVAAAAGNRANAVLDGSPYKFQFGLVDLREQAAAAAATKGPTGPRIVE